MLRGLGWRAANSPPTIPRYVLIAAPHTSNWDFLYVVLFTWALPLRVEFLGKSTLFWWPQGSILRRLGGIPVVRSGPQALVARLAALFAERERLVLLVPPEGTRGRAPHWKSGFFHVARAAGVPIVAARVDWANKTLRFGEPLEPGEDPRPLMETLRAFFHGATGRHQDRVTPVRLSSETEIRD